MTTFYMTPRFLAQCETLGVWVVLEVEGGLLQKEIWKRKKEICRVSKISNYNSSLLSMALLPALWLPIMFKCKFDLLGEDISDEGFVVGAVLPLHLDQQLVVHPASYLLISTLTRRPSTLILILLLNTFRVSASI